ncbi:Uncharacterised protein [Mycobacteroides abscessus subsp. abscessus]|nr:Uncharacterised protein [Mycobacteroides abscessus subsp. abscessus]
MRASLQHKERGAVRDDETVAPLVEWPAYLGAWFVTGGSERAERGESRDDAVGGQPLGAADQRHIQFA